MVYGPSRLNLELRILGPSERYRVARLKHEGRDEPPPPVTRVGEEIVEASRVDLLPRATPTLITAARCQRDRTPNLPARGRDPLSRCLDLNPKQPTMGASHKINVWTVAKG